MVAIIENLSDNRFSLNGIEYQKTFLPVAVGGSNMIQVVNVYDTKFVLVGPTRYTDFRVDGMSFSTREEAISVLSRTLYSRFTLDGVAEEFQQQILDQNSEFYQRIEGDFDRLQDDITQFEQNVNNDLIQIEAEKQVFESEAQDIKDALANMTTTGKIYDSLADAIAEDPKPADGTPFSVMGDGDNDGYYKFDSTQPDGVKFGRKFDRRIQVESISQLKNYKGRPGEAVDVLGYYESGDGGGGLFYWDSASTETEDGGAIIQATGITSGRWKRRYNGAVYLKWFGVKGDGETNDLPQLQAAFKFDEVIGEPDHIYKVDSQLVVINKNIKASNITILASETERGASFSVSGISSGTITGDENGSTIISQSINKLTVSDSSGIEAGQLIRITSDKLWYHDNRGNLTKGELSTIKSVNGNVIELSEMIQDDYDLTEEDLVYNTYPRYTIELDNFNVTRTNPQPFGGMVIGRFYNPILSNCSVSNCASAGISVNECFRGVMRNSHVFDCWVPGTSTGYGLQTNGSFGFSIIDSNFNNNRRGVDFSGSFPSRYCRVINSFITGNPESGSCIGTHGTADRCEFINNYLEHSANGVIIRGRNTLVSGNTFGTDIKISFITQSAGQGTTIKNNKVINTAPGRNNTGIFLYHVVPDEELPNSHLPLIVDSNEIHINRRFIQWGSNEMRYAFVKNNIITVRSNSSLNECLFIQNATNIMFCDVKDNIWRVTNGKDVFLDRSVTNIDNRNELQRIPIIDSDIEIGQGNNAVIHSRKVSIINGVLHFNFRIELTITSAGSLVIHLPISGASNVFNGEVWVSSSLNALNKTRSFYALTRDGDIYVSADNINYNAAFSEDTVIELSGSVEYRYPFYN